MKKLGIRIIGAALFAASTMPGASMAAVGVQIDLDGSNPGATLIKADKWTWEYNTFLCQGCIQHMGAASTVDNEGILFGQGEVLTMGGTGSGTEPGIGKFTFEFSMPVLSTYKPGTDGLDTPQDLLGGKIGDIVALDDSATRDFTSADNYFRIFWTPHFVNTPNDGAGSETTDIAMGTNFGTSTAAEAFDDTTVGVGEVVTILDAKVSVNQIAVTLTDAVSITPNLGDTASADSVNIFGSLLLDVNVCTAGDDMSVGSVCEGGVSTFDTNFWYNTIFEGFAVNALVEGTLKSPFEQPGIAEPDGPPVPNLVVGNTPDFGNGSAPQDTDTADSINALRCNVGGSFGSLPGSKCDFVVSSVSIVTTWGATIVPAPGTLALLGLGLLGAGALSRRKRTVASKD